MLFYIDFSACFNQHFAYCAIVVAQCSMQWVYLIAILRWGVGVSFLVVMVIAVLLIVKDYDKLIGKLKEEEGFQGFFIIGVMDIPDSHFEMGY